MAESEMKKLLSDTPGFALSDERTDPMSAAIDRFDVLGSDLSSYAGRLPDSDNKTLTVFYVGAVPEQAHSLAADINGVAVVLKGGARYSRAHGLDVAWTLAQDPQLAAAWGIKWASPRQDGSGVDVHTYESPPDDAAIRAAQAKHGISTNIVIYAGEQKDDWASGTRQNDVAPWSAGARIRRNTPTNKVRCSTAFATLAGTSGRLLSAHHCDDTDNAVVYDGALTAIAPGGSSVAGIASIDSQLIDPSASPATGPYVYSGSYNSGTKVTVKSHSWNDVDMPVCTSGATSGTRCGKIIDDGTTVPGLVGDFYIRAEGTGGAHIVALGDSGGPVYRLTTGGVIAHGVINKLDNRVDCSGSMDPAIPPVVYDSGGHEFSSCGSQVIYTPIRVLLNTWGITLETG